MRSPGQITCDMCGGPIAAENRVIRVQVPLTADLRQVIIADVQKRMPQNGIFGGLLPFDQLVPNVWTLECCGCVLGFLPNLAERVAADVQRVLAHRDAQEQAVAPLVSLEDL